MSHPKLNAEFVAKALNLPKPQNEDFSAVCTDSRKITAGSLFVALSGENFDGHQFLDLAIERGATGVLCRKGSPIEKKEKVIVFEVKDTLEAYRTLAHTWRKSFSIPVVVVAGSVGKTTTKEFTAALLSGKGQPVLKTHGSQNGFVGIPMTLMELKPHHGAAVIEVGIDDLGAMDEHMKIVEPTSGVLTAIGPEHLERLLTIENVAKEEGKALEAIAKSQGSIALNLDDPWIEKMGNTLPHSLITTFSLSGKTLPETHGKVLAQYDPKTQTLKVSEPYHCHLKLPLPGKHNASNLLAAFAVAVTLNLTSDEVQNGLQFFQGVFGRTEVQAAPNGTLFLCDYYNANPQSMRAAFELVVELAQHRKPQGIWFCLGDMLELGEKEELYHQELAESVLEFSPRGVLLLGPRMKSLRSELERQGYQGFRAHYEKHTDLVEALLSQVHPEDTVLIKGSRGMKMEEVWRIIQDRLKESS